MDGPPANRTWWGPRIWRILHTLAERNGERRDTAEGWRLFLRVTVDILPCEICREHFGAAVTRMRVPSGLRHGLWAAHAATGGGLPEADLGSVYGGSGVLDGVAGIVAEVVREFRGANVLDRFRIGHLVSWERAALELVRVLRTAPTPPSGESKPVARSGASQAGAPAAHRAHPSLRGRRRY
jgi:hypothetical protein